MPAHASLLGFGTGRKQALTRPHAFDIMPACIPKAISRNRREHAPETSIETPHRSMARTRTTRMTRHAFHIAFVTCALVLCVGAAAAAQSPEGQPCQAEPTDQLIAYGDHIQPCSTDLLGDSDLFRFQGTAGEVILIKVVDLAGSGQNPSCFVDLVRPDGTIAGSVQGSVTCEIHTILTQSGLFTARVSELGNNSLMTYSIELDRLAPPSPAATSVNPGDTVVGATINPRGDADLFIFNGVAGDTVSLRVTDQAGGNAAPSCVLELYRPDGTGVTSVSNTTTCIIDTTLNQTGVFTARVREQGDDHLMTYNLQYQCLLGSCPSFSTLSVTVVNDGTVTSNPPGINCGADCSERYFTGTVVTLTATPDPGGGFEAWSGDPDCVDGVVTMTETRNCVATFVISANPPTSVDDAYTTFMDNPLAVPARGVLTNDSSNAGGPMTAALVSGPTHGALGFDANGGFSYTPAPGFLGVDSFTYRAVNVNGPSPNIATVLITVEAPPGPQPPVGLVVDSVVGQLVTVRFTAPVLGPEPTGYVVKGGLLPGEVLAALTTGHTAPIFTFTAPTGSFFIRVHTLTDVGESEASNEVPLHVGVPVPPSPPASLTGLVDGSSVALAWKNTFAGGPPSNIILDVTGSITASLSLGPVENFTAPAVPGGTYTLRVRAANAGGSSTSSNEVTLTIPQACLGAPEIPENFLAYQIGNTIFVLWDPPESGPAPTNYVINVTGAFVGTLSTSARSANGAVGPGTYGLSVSARNPCGSSPLTPEQTVTIP
jgi:hypothetical protein